MAVRGAFILILAQVALWGGAPAGLAQVSNDRPPPGFYSQSGTCSLKDAVITYRDDRHEVNLQFDALGQLMIVDVMLPLDGVSSPYGGRVFGGYSYFSSPTGFQLKDSEAVFTITGRSGPGAHGLYFDYGTERWFGFAERVCADNDWLRNIRRKTGPFLVDMMNRGDIDIGVRIQDMARLVDRAMDRPVN
ncbi:MAG: hypothetical protein CBC49_003165 [Alphaproteobacteria bacterium TMED89]|nr:hypothetical protein [Rhodospirillaceae bacterium]RPH17208.1 MAG: hypothetical protein CBC49_003165 [Alphaproteobacteria bacterium TMED89]